MLMWLWTTALFAEAAAVHRWKRGWETLKEADKSPSEEKSFDPDGVSDIFSWMFANKSFPCPPPSFSALPVSGKTKWGPFLSEWDKQQPPTRTPGTGVSSALTHWLFYLMWNSERAEPPQLSASLSPHTTSASTLFSVGLFCLMR